MLARTCSFIKDNGERCQSAPMQDSAFCFWHDPEHAHEATEARRLGGLRRRKERAVQGAYEFEGIASVKDLQRVVEIAIIDTLSMENSMGRSRTLAHLVMVGLKLVEVGDHEERLAALEAALHPRLEAGKRR